MFIVRMCLGRVFSLMDVDIIKDGGFVVGGFQLESEVAKRLFFLQSLDCLGYLDVIEFLLGEKEGIVNVGFFYMVYVQEKCFSNMV